MSDSDAELMNTNELRDTTKLRYALASRDDADKHLTAAMQNVGPQDPEKKEKFDFHTGKVQKRLRGLKNANVAGETKPKTESIFMKMMTAKSDAQKPLAKKKPIVEPPSAKPKIQPEPKTYNIRNGPSTPDEFRDIIARARQKKQNTQG